MNALLAAASLYVSTCGLTKSTDADYSGMEIPYFGTPAEMLIHKAEKDLEMAKEYRECELARDKFLDAVAQANRKAGK